MESTPHPASRGRPGVPPASTPEKEALHIQAAAVAAQQAALTEEEARLQQRRAALEQQESQLAAHLEAKRQRLVRLREEAQAARSALQKDRASYEEAVAQARRDLTQTQQEVLQAREQARAESKRLADLRRRLKQRWHRHWMAEHRALRQRLSELISQRHQLDKDRERLEQERADLTQARLRASTEAELGKRMLRAERDKLYEERQSWQTALGQRTRALARRETAVAQAERDQLYDRHQWHGVRLFLEQEAAGLEARVRNLRSKILEQQQEIGRLNAALRDLRTAGTMAPPVLVPVAVVAPSPAAPEPVTGGALTNPPPGAAPGEEPVSAGHRASGTALAEVLPAGSQALPAPPEDALQRRLRALERLAEELADQRLQLAEQWEHLAQTQHRWQEARDSAAVELEALTAGLPERERALGAREQRLEGAECDLRRRHEEAALLRQHLEARQARLRVREEAWEAERDRLLAALRAREALTEQLQTTLGELRQRLARRHRQELDRLCGERAACERARKEWVALREDWWRRHTALEDKRRGLAEKELALERYHQEVLTGTEDAAAAERVVERLRRRVARLHENAVRATAERRRKLAVEAAHLEARFEALHKQTEAVTQREASLAEQQAALEHREALVRGQQVRAGQEMQRLRVQRDRYEQQTCELREELERLARLLLNEPAMSPQIVDQAA
jgi:chromosome segregation ATPase